MPATARPKPGPDYLRVTAQGLQEHAALLAADAPPPAPAPPVLSAAEQAARLRELGAAYLHAVGSHVFGESVDLGAWKLYVDAFVKELGVSGTAGPVARLLAEQLLLAHHALGRLLIRTGARTSAVETAAYHAAAARLLGECRRTGLALRACTAGAARRTAAPRTSARPPSGVRPARGAKKGRRGKVGSNGDRVRGHSRGREHAVRLTRGGSPPGS